MLKIAFIYALKSIVFCISNLDIKKSPKPSLPPTTSKLRGINPKWNKDKAYKHLGSCKEVEKNGDENKKIKGF